MFFIAFILLVASEADCAQLSLQWDESPSPGVDGYIVYDGTQSRNYTESFDVGNTTSCVISNLVEGQIYYFAASAYYNNNSNYIEGVLSEELSFEVPLATVSTADCDGDGILDDMELYVYGTDPQKADTDDDGLNDGAELAFLANDWDSDDDGDGLVNLLDPDSDNDGFLDGIEFDNGYDPMDPNS
jgi:hypothetical protein